MSKQRFALTATVFSLLGVVLSMLFLAAIGKLNIASEKDERDITIPLRNGQTLKVSPETIENWRTRSAHLKETESALIEATRKNADLGAQLESLQPVQGAAEPAGTTSQVEKEAEPADQPAAGGQAESTEDEKTKKFRAFLATVNWDKLAKAMHASIEFNRQLRKGGSPTPDPAFMDDLAYLSKTISQLMELSGEENWDTWAKDIVSEHLRPAFLATLGVELSDVQRANLLEWTRTQKSWEGAGVVGAEPGFGRFDSLLKQATEEIQFTEWLRTNVAPSQYSAYCAATENDLFYRKPIARPKEFKAATEDEAARLLVHHWQEIFGAQGTTPAELVKIADQFVQDYYAITYSYKRLYGGEMPRHASLEMQFKLLQLQAAAEQQCHSLFPEANPEGTTIIIFK